MRTRAQPVAERFWTALAAGQFELPCCGLCGAWQEPDAASCERCGSLALAWEAAPTGGTVFSAMTPLSGGGRQSRTIAVVDMDAGLRLMGVIEAASGAVRPGARVAAVVPSLSGAERLLLLAESSDPYRGA